jgi:hypothetical protein
MKKILCLTLLVLFIAACGGRMAKPEERSAGPVPDYERVIKLHLGQALFDPDSLKDFSIDLPCIQTTLTSGYPAYNLVRGMDVYECKYVWYNAKNRMGGYVGKKPHIYWIRSNEVVAVW